MEAWKLNKEDMRRLQVFEIWIYKSKLRVSWVDQVTNNKILRRMGKEAEKIIIRTIKTRKLKYLGHFIRGER